MRFIQFTLFVLLFISRVTFAETASFLSALQMIPKKDQSVFTFVFTKKTTGKLFYDAKDKIVTIVYRHTNAHFDMNEQTISRTNVSKILMQRVGKDDLAFSFRVIDPISWRVDYLPTKNNQGVKLQLTLTSLKPEKPPGVFHALLDKPLKPSTNVKKLLVVIDPGHGGRDPGTVDSSGIKEKDVVLNIAILLANHINRTQNMRAILTRDHDQYLSLRNRTTLARQNKADMFIAIHADGYFIKSAKGASVYALSSRGATSEAARWLAKKDNSSELSDMHFGEVKSPVLRSVLLDMTQTATINDSLRLGKYMLSHLDAVSSLHHKKVDQAPFVVLKSPDIPSILVETGFLTNPYEAKRLDDARYQNNVALAMLRALQDYTQST